MFRRVATANVVVPSLPLGRYNVAIPNVVVSNIQFSNVVTPRDRDWETLENCILETTTLH